MSDTQTPDTNMFTGLPYENEGERLAAENLLDELRSDVEFGFAQNPEIRDRQLKFLWRGAGQIPTRTSIALEPAKETEIDDQVLGIYDYPGSTFGQPTDRVRRLVEQGQATNADGDMGPAERFARKYPTWRPGSKGEMTVAMRGLLPTVERMRGAPLSRIEDTISQARTWQREASNQATLLQEVPEGISYSDDLRGHDQAMQVLTILRAAGRQFEDEKWLIRGKKPSEDLLSEVKAELDTLSDHQLSIMHTSAINAAAARSGFWQSEIVIALRHPRVQMAELEKTQRSRQ